MSGLAQLLVWNFISDYPGIVSTREKKYATLWEPNYLCVDGHVGVIRLLRVMLLVPSDTCGFVRAFAPRLLITENGSPVTAARFYGTENLAGLTGLLFLFAAPGE